MRSRGSPSNSLAVAPRSRQSPGRPAWPKIAGSHTWLIEILYRAAGEIGIPIAEIGDAPRPVRGAAQRLMNEPMLRCGDSISATSRRGRSAVWAEEDLRAGLAPLCKTGLVESGANGFAGRVPDAEARSAPPLVASHDLRSAVRYLAGQGITVLLTIVHQSPTLRGPIRIATMPWETLQIH
jgi:hypothetical protein